MDVKKAIEERRAYRSLIKTKISRSSIKELIEAARLCCSAENNQPWRFVFVTDPELMDRLHATFIADNAWAVNASMYVAVCSNEKLDDTVNDRDILGMMSNGGKLSSNGNERPYYLFDTGMATGFMILRAVELGLVAHPIAGYLEQRVQKILGIPKNVTVAALLVVGKRAKTIDPELPPEMKKDERVRPARLPAGEIAFMDRYVAKPPKNLRRPILNKKK